MNIPFNKPYFSGDELKYIEESIKYGKISGDGAFTKKCHDFFHNKYNFSKVLLTTSCTDALEMSAILLDIQEGDEVIAPSYTFVSTVNAFVLRGAKIVFADSMENHPNLDVDKLEMLITPKTKVIVPVHYAGVACDMDKLLALAQKYNLFVVEDAAQSIDSFYKDKPLGSFGAFGTFSFHETKNIISGEGGMLTINESEYFERAEIIREKGTNRSQFFRGEVNKYGWVDYGSSFLPSDIIAAYLFAQLENLAKIQSKRINIWKQYYNRLTVLEKEGTIKLPIIPAFATNNAHMFYILCNSLEDRTGLILHLKSKGVMAVFHYLSLHKSSFMNKFIDNINIKPKDLTFADLYTDTLLRLPFYNELDSNQIDFICDEIIQYYLK